MKGRDLPMDRCKRPALMLALFALLLSCFAASSPRTDAARPSAESFKTVAYYPSWRPDSQRQKLQYDKLTHIIYAFAIPTADGTLRPLENAAGAQALIREAHAHGVKVLLAVGGWSYQNIPLEDTFAAATDTAQKRASFTEAIVSMCDQYGFDGVDMDWEYPRTSGTYRQYEDLMLRLKARLQPAGKLLTTAVPGGVSLSGTPYASSMAFTDTVLQTVDWVNVMAYDANNTNHSPYDYAVHAANYWRYTRALPAEKVVLGVPFYTRPGSISYESLLKADPKAGLSDTITYNGQTVWYNGPATIAAKTQYALEHLGGVMIWEITQDTADASKSLLSVIHETVQSASRFSDVPSGAWYAESVQAACDLGLMKGTGNGRFSPARPVTTAETVSLSARVHVIHQNGSDPLVQGTPWYQVYLDYAHQTGILTDTLTSQRLSTPITRLQCAILLRRALPDSALSPIRTVEEIPDLSPDTPGYDAVLTLYRAGVLTGTDAAGAFSPHATLTRAEAAVLVSRMLDPNRRVSH